MATFLFDDIVFGPVFSRRLGISLGVNLQPAGRKVCTFSCVYCECGHTMNGLMKGEKIPSREEVKEALAVTLGEMSETGQVPDAITFAGNGEPTIHPAFACIIDDTISLRNRYFPEAAIAVLSNSTTLGDEVVRDALMKIDRPILKLDSAIESTFRSINRPAGNFSVQRIIEGLTSYTGKFTMQTLFVRGEAGGDHIDNTSQEEIEALIDAYRKTGPDDIQVYTISRDVPSGNKLEPVQVIELERIAGLIEEAGFPTLVTG